jgi:hypothetical protein
MKQNYNTKLNCQPTLMNQTLAKFQNKTTAMRDAALYTATSPRRNRATDAHSTLQVDRHCCHSQLLYTICLFPSTALRSLCSYQTLHNLICEQGHTNNTSATNVTVFIQNFVPYIGLKNVFMDCTLSHKFEINT